MEMGSIIENKLLINSSMDFNYVWREIKAIRR